MNTSIFKTLFLSLAVSSLFSACTFSILPVSKNVQEEVEKSLDLGFDGIIVYVNQGGKASYYSAGIDNKAAQTAANPHKLFKIASVSKLYTASAATMLIADGKLSLDATLLEMIPEVEGRIEHADEITLRMMLKHRSGIPDFIDQKAFYELPEGHSMMDILEVLYNLDAEFRPDWRHKYSNTNYLLIREIMDRTLGYNHLRFFKEQILLPNAWTNTYTSLDSVPSLDHIMSGYYYESDEDAKENGWSMIATAEDVGEFVLALNKGSFFTTKEQEIYAEVYEYEHTGWMWGYCSIMRYHEDIDAVVVQFVNTSEGEMFWIKLKRNYNRIVRSVEKSAIENRIQLSMCK